MYAGGPLLNLRLLGLFIFETEILLKLLCQQLYFTDFLRALQLKSTFKYYDRYIHIPNVSTEVVVRLCYFKLKIILSIFLSWPCSGRGSYWDIDHMIVKKFLFFLLFSIYSLSFIQEVFELCCLCIFLILKNCSHF